MDHAIIIYVQNRQIKAAITNINQRFVQCCESTGYGISLASETQSVIVKGF